jgi:acyl-CoA reductase-like NAD-dependent aldehyde dehydrogenase
MLLMHRNCRVEYKPLGVIGAIVPWNYPFHNAFSPVSAALMTGNAIVVKWSEFGAVGRAMTQEIISSVLRARGQSPDLVQFLPGYGDTGAALVQCPQIAKILFIGSPATGAFRFP